MMWKQATIEQSNIWKGFAGQLSIESLYSKSGNLYSVIETLMIVFE